MNVGPFQILIIALVVLVLFGRGRISEMMGDFGKGVKSFRKGLNEDEDAHHPPARIESKPAPEPAPRTAEAKPSDSSNTSN